MPQLLISLLGTPQFTLNGIPLKIPTSRAIPLFAYLAITGQVQTRENLANLLWPDSNQKQALAALRTLLWRLKSAGLENWIVLDRDEIYLNPHQAFDVDVLTFKALLDQCNTHGHPPSQICMFCTPLLTEAVKLFQGEFMSGINLSKAFTFDNWRMQQSETLESLHLNALERLVRCHRTFGDFNLAIHYARLWLSCDRLNESAHFQLLQLFSVTGQRSAGISLYKNYKAVISRELGIEPSEEITALYKQIITGRSIPPSSQKVKTPVFLTADIEQSTLYWARAGEKKTEILNSYTSILKETAHEFGGVVLQKSEGNITLLFENGQPLHCAVTIHLRLKKANWSGFDSPNIRMVLYSSVMEGETPGNFATITHTASTLLSRSWGGQIIFSDQTLRLLDVPSGSSLKDLGFHFINDHEGSIHVYELLHPHLPKIVHPPLQSATQKLVNFPNSTLPFIGRERELDELIHILNLPHTRLISLVGPGGVGKTSLAIQVASRATETFPDGIFFISFTSIDNPDFIPIMLADVLKFTYYGPTSQVEQLGGYLHRLKILLVIDNFEHLRAEGAEILARLLTHTLSLTVLVTSRERLNLIAETIYEVHGLPVPASIYDQGVDDYDSMKLFNINAQKTFPRFSYANNREAIITICQLVDGIPLGILLASSWVRMFSCREIASEIKKNIDFLVSSAPDIDPRHRSMNAVFDNSWRLLSEDEQQIIRRLSIFQTAFTSTAAQRICGSTPLLMSLLTDKSLLNHRPDDRFEMLTTFHQYASAKLEAMPGELFITRAKYCNYYADFCAHLLPDLNDRHRREVFNEMLPELENICTAWAWMVNSGYWELLLKVKDPLLECYNMLGNYSQGGEVFQGALQRLNNLKDPNLVLVRAHMLYACSWFKFRNGFVNESLPGLHESLELFSKLHVPLYTAITLFVLAEAYRILDNLNLAKDYVIKSMELFQSDEIPKSIFTQLFIAQTHSVLGTIQMSLGDFDLALRNMQTSLASIKSIGVITDAIHPLMGLGELALLKNDFLQAKDLLLQALSIAENTTTQRYLVIIHNQLGAIYELIGHPMDSYHHVQSALKYCQESGDHRLTAITLNNVADHQLRFLQQPAESIWTYQKCLEIFSNIGDLRGLAYTYYDISKAYIKVGLFDEAWNYCLQSLNTSRTLDSVPLLIHSLHGFANLFAKSHQIERALGLCYLLIDQPIIDEDTLKRLIVTKVELEATHSPEVIQAARNWAETILLDDVVAQILDEKSPTGNS